jgi:hypothetical protein
MIQTVASVEEIPGLYGSVRMEEDVLQEIWAVAAFRQDGLFTQCGKRVAIRSRGNWNRAEEGPDFKQSLLLIDGMESSGDVEIHFHPQDWEAHGHNKDPNYNQVILHVCLFPHAIPGKQFRTASGKNVPTLVLLPHLLQSLEEFAEERALAKLAGIMEIEEDRTKMAQLAMAKNIEFARERWIQKLAFARKRIDRLGWETACHQWFLEVLGYKRNRVPMARIASQYSITEWRQGVKPEKLYENETEWKLRGSRPANHPAGRLSQYAELIRKQPDWPDLLRKLEVPSMTEPEGQGRKSLGLSAVRNAWKEKILRETLGGSRLDTLWIDACLPLWAAETGSDPFATWFHWQLGDFPSHLIEQAKKYELIGTSDKVACNGILQGFLGFCLDRTD